MTVRIVANNTKNAAHEQIVCLYRIYEFRLCNVKSFMIEKVLFWIFSLGIFVWNEATFELSVLNESQITAQCILVNSWACLEKRC